MVLEKLKRLYQAANFLEVYSYMLELTERKTYLIKWIKSLMDSAKFLANKPTNPKGFENMDGCFENTSYSIPITKCTVSSKSSICLNCGWVKCQCDWNSEMGLSFIQTPEIFPTDYVFMKNEENIKLNGGGRPKIIRPPKIRIISPGNKMINTLGSVFRTLNDYWFLFDDHKKCNYREENPCTFCAFRSLSQRLNQAKREPSIQPYELMMQTEIFELQRDQLTFDFIIDQTITLMCEKNRYFSNNANLNLACEGCGKIDKLSSSSLISIGDENQYDDISDILLEEIRNLKNRRMPCCKHDFKMLKVSGNQILLFIIFQNNRNLKTLNEFKIGEEHYVYKCHVQEIEENSNLSYKAHFLNKDLILHQPNREIVLSNLEEMKENVKFVVLSKKIVTLLYN